MVVFHHEDIQRLEIPVDNIFGVHILNTQTEMDEYFPNYVLYEKFVAHRFLFLNLDIEISHHAILQHNIDFLTIDERV